MADGERCSNDLARSNSHFATLTQAVGAAQDNPGSVEAAADAFKALDAFDRSRKAFQEEAPVAAKAQGYVAAVAASDRRLALLARETTAFDRSRTPADALGVLDAMSKITDLDRARPSGQQALAAAKPADQAVQAGRGKLSGLSQVLAAAKNSRTPESERQLIAAAAAVTPFDEGVATPEQRQTLGRARAAAADVTWTMLRNGVAGLEQRGAPSDYETVAALYGFVKRAPLGGLTEEQRQLLAKAQAAADALAASDQRLADVLTADKIWRERGIARGDAVSSALRAVTPFDRSRFDGPHKDAWGALSRAEIILVLCLVNISNVAE